MKLGRLKRLGEQLPRRYRNQSSYENAWAQGVLTLVTIVLGVAMAVAAQKLFDIYEAPGKDITVPIALQSMAVFFIITGTFYHCYTFTSFFHVVPSILWVVLPTATGVGVIMSAYALGNTERFLVATFVFYCAGASCFAFALIEKWRSRVGTPLNDVELEEKALMLFRKEMVKNVACFTLMGSFTAAIYYFLFFLKAPSGLAAEVYYTAMSGLIYGFMVWWTEFRFLAPARDIWSAADEPSRP